jgi:lysophospholipase L1-like esterase
LEERALLAVTIGALGDSITAPYSGTSQGSAGDLCWVELLRVARPGDDVSVQDVARGGATSSTLLSQGQHTRVASLVSGGSVSSAVLIIGANDVSAYLTDILAGRYDRFVNAVVPNIYTAAATVLAAGPVELVVSDIPDIGVTPRVRSLVHNDPVLLQRISTATAQANDQILSLAAANGVPVVDFFGLSHVADAGSIEMADVAVNYFFAPDGFHPSSVAQGILANTLLAALQIGYGEDVTGLPLSDQEILTLTGIDHPPGESYLDVTPYVIFNPGNRAAPPGHGTAGSVAAAAARQADPVSGWVTAPAAPGGGAHPQEVASFYILGARSLTDGSTGGEPSRLHGPAGAADPTVALLIFLPDGEG